MNAPFWSDGAAKARWLALPDAGTITIQADDDWDFPAGSVIRKDFRLGDSMDVDLAQIEWMPTADGKTSVFVGKVDSVIGHEYKSRKPPARFGITP